MARNEKLYVGPAEVDGVHHDRVEVWVASPTVIAAIVMSESGSFDSIAVTDPVLEFVEGCLVVTGANEHEVRSERPRAQRGAWLGQSVTDVDGTVLYEDVTVTWSDQGVSIVTALGERVEFPGATTRVLYGVKSIVPWSGDPASTLRVLAMRRGCSRCGGGGARR